MAKTENLFNGIDINKNDIDEVVKNEIIEEEKSHKRGRKASEPNKKIRVAVPLRLLDDIQLASEAVTGGNITKYIVKVIEKDLADHKDLYKFVSEIKG